LWHGNIYSPSSKAKWPPVLPACSSHWQFCTTNLYIAEDVKLQKLLLWVLQWTGMVRGCGLL
jgi:hypothetical protein